MSSNLTKDDWKVLQRRKRHARSKAEELVEAFGIAAPPVDPFVLIKAEHPLLKVKGGDFGDLFDGQLEYHAQKNRFLLFYNTKYDSLRSEHPRTRFSLSHELGHYYLPEHRLHLVNGGQPHKSQGEFSSIEIIETEADCFAAGLLTPKALVAPRINIGELNFERIKSIGTLFNVSMTSASISCIQMSHYPCAIVAIKDGKILWQCLSDPLVEAGAYPNYSAFPHTASKAWSQFRLGATIQSSSTYISNWCSTFGNGRFYDRYFTEEYLPIPVMGTLLCLLTADEREIN